MKSLPKPFALLLVVGCGTQAPQPPQPQTAPAPANIVQSPNVSHSLTAARRGFKTKLIRQVAAKLPVDQPPAELFRVVHYESPAGNLAAYLGQPGKNDGRSPAIVWIFGGFDNSIGDIAWLPAPRANDQSASAFRKAGIIMMYPSFRGGNENPGFTEGSFGEVDDVLAAADYLAKQDFVDPKRIYLGGHSTGGTVALLAAECSDRFRAVFSFGPVEDVAGYGAKNLTFDTSNPREFELRSPIRWLENINMPTFVFEGEQGNIGALQAMARSARNANTRFITIPGGDHFNVLAPATELVAQKILRDDGPKCNLIFTEDEVNGLLKK